LNAERVHQIRKQSLRLRLSRVYHNLKFQIGPQPLHDIDMDPGILIEKQPAAFFHHHPHTECRSQNGIHQIRIGNRGNGIVGLPAAFCIRSLVINQFTGAVVDDSQLETSLADTIVNVILM